MMRIQLKLTGLVFLVLVGTVAAVVWKTRDQLVQDRLGFIADSAMKQVAPLKRLTQDRLDEQKNRLIKFAGARASLGASLGAGRAKAPAPYDVVALVQNGQSQWSPLWVEKTDAPKSDLPIGFETTLLKSLPYARVRDGETFWVRLSDRQGAPLYAVLVSVEIQSAGAGQAAATGTALPDSVDYTAQPTGAGRKALVVGISAHDPLADLTEEYIGSTNTVYIVDDKGYVASHVNKAYLGNLFSEDPIVAEIINTKKTAASGNYQDLERRAVLGHFERIDRTNLYAVITTPLKATQDLAAVHVRTALSTAAAVGLLGLFIFWLFSRQIGGRAEEREPARSEAQPRPRFPEPAAPPNVAKPIDIPPPAGVPQPVSVQTAGPSPTEALKVGFVNAMKEPLLAILGHAQLVKSKAQSEGQGEQVGAHAESIEREARRAKEIVDRLTSWSEKATAPKNFEPLDLRAIVESVLNEQDETLKAEGIYVAKELHAVPKVRGSAEEIKVALMNLIDNAREAMRARPKKHLRVKLEFHGETISLAVGDSGIGMTRDVKERAFEPFYKSFDSPDHVGLGLALVSRAVKSMDGQCEIESTVGEGATFTLKIPVATEDRQLFMSAPVAALAAAPANVSAERVELPPPVREDEVELLPAAPKASFLAEGKDFIGDDVDSKDDGDEDDEDEEKFTSVPISKNVVQERFETKPAQPVQPEPTDTDPDGFRVRIRRPRVRS